MLLLRRWSRILFFSKRYLTDKFGHHHLSKHDIRIIKILQQHGYLWFISAPREKLAKPSLYRLHLERFGRTFFWLNVQVQGIGEFSWLKRSVVVCYTKAILTLAVGGFSPTPRSALQRSSAAVGSHSASRASLSICLHLIVGSIMHRQNIEWALTGLINCSFSWKACWSKIYTIPRICVHPNCDSTSILLLM